MSRRSSPLTVDALKARLSALSGTSPVPPVEPAAMCYRMAAPPQTAEYVCPVDGERTQYARDSGLVDLVRALPAMRSAVRQLQDGLDASLDERALCRKCTPAAAATPSVALEIRHADGRLVRTEGVGTNDLRLLVELLSGQELHSHGRNAKTPLKKHLPRLRALLGIP